MSAYPYSSGHSRREAVRKAKRRDENMAFSTELKRRIGGCQLSGQKLPPEELEWHHCDPSQKKRKITKMYRLSHAQFLAELSKCICIARDIHRAIHAPNKKSLGGNTVDNHYITTIRPKQPGLTESMQVCLPGHSDPLRAQFMIPMPPPAEIAQQPRAGYTLFVYAWIEGNRYWIIIHSRSLELEIITREPSKTKEMQGFYASATILDMTRRLAPDVLKEFWVDSRPTIIDGHTYWKIKRAMEVIGPAAPAAPDAQPPRSA